jgi:hypothetical protein
MWPWVSYVEAEANEISIFSASLDRIKSTRLMVTVNALDAQCVVPNTWRSIAMEAYMIIIKRN